MTGTAATRRRPRCRRYTRSDGFTIFELAITLAIIATLAGAILVPFVTQVTQRNISATEKILDEVKETLMGFAVANGRFPCPATAASNGAEMPLVPVADGSCTTNYGFLPAATLGFTPVDDQGYAIDAWGSIRNRIRYAVSNQTVNGIANPFTRAGGTRSATAASIAAADLLFVCAGGTGLAAGPPPTCGAEVTLTRNAPVVIWSVGANAATGGTSPHETRNPNPQNEVNPDRVFVSRSRSDVAGSEFDDIVTWLSVGNLVSRMVLGGQLP